MSDDEHSGGCIDDAWDARGCTCCTSMGEMVENLPVGSVFGMTAAVEESMLLDMVSTDPSCTVGAAMVCGSAMSYARTTVCVKGTVVTAGVLERTSETKIGDKSTTNGEIGETTAVFDIVIEW